MGLKPIDICHCICLGQYEHLHTIPDNRFFIGLGLGLCQREHTLSLVLLVHLWCYTCCFSATLSFDLDEYCARMMCLSPEGRIIVLGAMKYGNKWLFMVYDIHNGARLQKIPLQEDDQPNGMAMVKVAGNQCVAVSYRYSLFTDRHCAAKRGRLCFHRRLSFCPLRGKGVVRGVCVVILGN